MAFWNKWKKEKVAVTIPKQVRIDPVRKYRNSFLAAATNRLTNSWYVSLTGPNREIQTDVKRLRALSRYLARNDVYTTRFLTLIETRVVGPEGLKFQPRVMNAQNDMDTLANRELSRAWKEWGQYAGLNGQNFLDIEQLVSKTVAQDGEVFVRLIEDARVNKYGLALQIIDADLLDNHYTDVHSANGNTIVQGVEIDRLGHVVAYHFWTAHPDDVRTGVPISRERIDADEILHIYRPNRAGQYRGIPWITPAMYFLAKLHEYMDAELVGAQAAASQIATIETQLNDAATMAQFNDREIIDMEPGVAIRLAPGEKMSPWNTSRPTSAFDAFVKAMLHGIASALNVSYSTLASDMSEDNYSSARMSGNYEQKHFDNLQAWYARAFHQRVLKVWLRTSLTTGALNLKGDVADYTNVVFRGMKMPSPDLLKDLGAAEKGFANNVISKTQWCAERGYDYLDVLDDRYEEMMMERQYEQYLKEMGLEPVEVQNEQALNQDDHTSYTGDTDEVVNMESTVNEESER